MRDHGHPFRARLSPTDRTESLCSEIKGGGRNEERRTFTLRSD